VKLIAKGEVELDVFRRIVPRTAFTILKNHTVNAEPYSVPLIGKVTICHQPDIYALSLSRVSLIKLAAESRATIRFFSGGLVASEDNPHRVYAIDKNFLSRYPIPVLPKKAFIIDKGGVPEHTNCQISLGANLDTEEMELFQGGLVSISWNCGLPIKTISRVIPKVRVVELKTLFPGSSGSPGSIAAVEKEGMATGDYVPPHCQEVWLGVYDQPVCIQEVSSDSFSLSGPSQLRYPKFYPGHGYETPGATDVHLDDLHVLFVDGIEVLERIYKESESEGRKVIGDFEKKVKALLDDRDFSVAPVPSQEDEERWSDAGKYADDLIRKQVGSTIDLSVFYKLAHVVAAARFSWQETEVKSECNAARLKIFLKKDGVIGRKKADVLSPLVRRSVETSRSLYKKKHEQDNCILSTHLRSILEIVRKLREIRKQEQLCRMDMKMKMDELLKAYKIDAEEASDALYDILVPKEMFK
jgi:hypothetical protein